MNRRRRGLVPLGLLSLGLVVALGASASTRAAAQASGDGKLDVTVTYKGKGEVKPANTIAVFVFGSPTIDDSSNPIGVQKIEKIRVDLEPERRSEMTERTQRRTVPQIYIGETHVGGFEELSELERAGKLDPLLQMRGLT